MAGRAAVPPAVIEQRDARAAGLCPVHAAASSRGAAALEAAKELERAAHAVQLGYIRQARQAGRN